MTTFVWVMVALFTFNCVFNVYYLGSGKAPSPTTPGVRAVALVIEGVFLVWALAALGVL